MRLLRLPLLLMPLLALIGCETAPPPEPAPKAVSAQTENKALAEDWSADLWPKDPNQPYIDADSIGAMVTDTMFGDDTQNFQLPARTPSGQVGTRPVSDESVFPIHATGGSLALSGEITVPSLGVQRVGEDRIRILVRVSNRTDRNLRVDVKCEPELDQHRLETFWFDEIEVPASGYRDFSFVISGSLDRRFTILVRRSWIANARPVGV